MKHHLMIAGTGRAGTSFLVQYLHGCGLETHISHHPEVQLSEHANSGLEDVPVGEGDLPYVLKTPWLFNFVDKVLNRDDIVIDAVVLPMRDIVEVASSRGMLEMRARYGDTSIPDECTQWETWGATPGGVVYSLNPIDQARILALGFHQVVHAFVKRGVPIIFLDFPRLIDDEEYLYESLKPVLGDTVDRSAALEVHRALADRSLVRVGSEMNPDSPQSPSQEAPISFPPMKLLDRAALLRELKSARRKLKEVGGGQMPLFKSLRRAFRRSQ